MNKESNPPDINEKAFECPFCGAYTSQYWKRAAVIPVRTEDDHEDSVPFIPDPDKVEAARHNPTVKRDPAQMDFVDHCTELLKGRVFVSEKAKSEWAFPVNNLHVTQCHRCKEFAVWVYNKVVFPPQDGLRVKPNPDLNEDIQKDFLEAASIANASPRGACALLRVCCQKVCLQLGLKGKDLDGDIQKLVDRGLNPGIQQSLDALRVIGNNAVHPSELNFSDNMDTVVGLFGCVNAIADQLITHPKKAKEIYESLPDGAKAAITKRNERAQNKQGTVKPASKKPTQSRSGS